MNIQRKPNSPYIKSVRPMTRDDLQFLREKSSRPVIQKLRESHHIVARLLASGMSQGDIAIEVGYSASRISLLAGSPAVQELVAKYRGMATEEWRKNEDLTYQSIMSATRKAARKLNDMLDDDEDKNEMAVGTVLKIFDSGADRVGYHRRSTKENINMDFAASLERAIAAQANMKVIEHEE